MIILIRASKHEHQTILAPLLYHRGLVVNEAARMTLEETGEITQPGIRHHRGAPERARFIVQGIAKHLGTNAVTAPRGNKTVMEMCSSQEVAGSGRPCKQGFLQRHREGRVICCLPVRCGRGQTVVGCSRNETKDTCEPCSQHSNQSVRTSSFDIRDCYHWDLDENCRHTTTRRRDLNSEEVQWCMCDVEKGVYFKPPEVTKGAPNEAFCQPNKESKCKPGMEPMLNGSCKRCDRKYFKSETGFSLCEQKTDCFQLGLAYLKKSDDATKDNVCSKPVIVTTPKPVTREPIKSKPEPPDPEPSTPSPPSSASTTVAGGSDGSVQLGSSRGTNQSHDGGDDDPSLAGPIL
ncbi:hypothetical protein ElyMa_006497900 [Elysia marginata]|uniref:Thyroglobulin type-1 domain-containing protein n=1 Tax=Elysia marginata TaxID=1093978 RepID=A0AAV4I3U6_9GAST|nr:hypothetical protein ElyMa_006497900 [Elysia marginata]